ncbi:hypothetical protein KAREA_26480 [Prescottella equi]|nr:hypothetical protein KAREA_26480 [Prescottella equi]
MLSSYRVYRPRCNAAITSARGAASIVSGVRHPAANNSRAARVAMSADMRELSSMDSTSS